MIITISLGLLIGSGVAFSIFYKDEIITYFLQETNKHISTPIEVEQIEVSVFNYFPNISINLHGVTIFNKDKKGYLGKAKRISASFSPLDIIDENYTISGLHFSDVDLKLHIDEKGEPNYLFYKQDSTSTGTNFITLKNVTGERLNIDYLDEKSDYHVALFVKKAASQIVQHDKVIYISGTADLVSDEIKVGERRFFNNKVIGVDTELEWNLNDKTYHFKSGNLQVDKGEFDVTGIVDVKQRNIDLAVKGINTSFQSINSLLSNDFSQSFKDYRSRGDVYFSGKVKGNYGDSANPEVTIEFGAENASFFHPEYKKQIKNVNFSGYFSTGSTNKRENYQLDLKDFSCTLEDKSLVGSMKLHDFVNYNIDFALKGEASVNTLILLFPEKVKAAHGNVVMDIHAFGSLKNPKLGKGFNAEGEIEFRNISFVMEGEKLPFNKISGSIMLRKNDLAVSNFVGEVGNSNFKINGFVKDFSNTIFTKRRVYKMQADLQSSHLDFDELLKSNFASRDTLSAKSGKYSFGISPDISLDFNCDIDELRFERFFGRSIKGQIAINNRIAVLKNISFASMGGQIKVSGSVNNKNDNLIETIAEASFQQINIDSAFYVFKNFKQDWLVDKNLKGQVDADINLYMNFDKNLVLNSKSLVADINTSIKNGELNNFEPMMQLSKFVEEESLANMRFSQMTNKIRIENRTIYLPEMEIKSNVSNILISGQHTFDKVIDYHLRVPLKSFIRISKKKRYSDNARNGMNLLLKITGTTSDYRISYDTKALKENIKKDFLDEGKEWRNIKNKDAIEKENAPELEEEFFDF